jgi:transposase
MCLAFVVTKSDLAIGFPLDFGCGATYRDPMFLRRTTQKDELGRRYHTFKLVESFRTQRGPRQRDVLNLGSSFSLPRDQWKALADRVETIITGQSTFLSVSKKVEALAQRYAKEIISKQGQVLAHAEEAPVETDYQTVDVNSVDNEHIRSVGGESVVLDSIKHLELDRKLEELGLGRDNVNAAIGVITGRLLLPSSERATHIWLQNGTALEDLLGTSFGGLSQDRVYKVSDFLLKNKSEIESHLEEREKNLFSQAETVLLYDLTNTFFEGSGKYNSKAHFGVSKEKRSDCPLVTLGLLLNGEGFPKRSEVFEGNVSEPGTLSEMLSGLYDGGRKPIVVADAGIGTEGNVKWLKKEGFGYIVVSRKRLKELPPDLEMVVVRADDSRVIRASSHKNDQGELEVYCHSSAKEVKEEGIKTRFEKRFESALEQIQEGLSIKGRTKSYEKVLEKIGRLKEKNRRVSKRYEIEVEKDEGSNRAKSVNFTRKETDDTVGYYVLRTNRTELGEKGVFDIFNMLLDVEDAFRCMKSELGLRPVHHQKEVRCDGHLFITVLAYHVLQAIRVRLRQSGITNRWWTIRRMLSTHHRVTTSMRREDGKMIYIRKTSRPEECHVRIYEALGLPSRPGKTVKTII